jgi:hypothetical protein
MRKDSLNLLVEVLVAQALIWVCHLVAIWAACLGCLN